MQNSQSRIKRTENGLSGQPQTTEKFLRLLPEAEFFSAMMRRLSKNVSPSKMVNQTV